MISNEELQRIAGMKGLPQRLAETDYLQDLSLMSVCREFGNRLIFKGGTCMHKVYKLDRFSEDLDFTAVRNVDVEFLRRLPRLLDLLDIGSRMEIESHGSAVNAYLHVRGPLYDGTKESVNTIVFNISFRERLALPAIRMPYMPLYSEVRPFDIFAMDEREILAEKIRAVYTRKKIRDVYDIWYLLKRRSIAFDRKMADRKLEHSGHKAKFGRSAFLSRIAENEKEWGTLSALLSGELPSFGSVKKDIAGCIG